jgi:superfamily II DNA/RNA helicase
MIPPVDIRISKDSLVSLREQIAAPALVLHGGLTREERASVLAAFAQAPRGLLLATDAAAEGLNLHHHCRLVINLELPWNPMRLEQRIGRVDRIGQRRAVHAFHLVAGGTGETRLLAHLKTRVASAQAARFFARLSGRQASLASTISSASGAAARTARMRSASPSPPSFTFRSLRAAALRAASPMVPGVPSEIV